MLTSVWDIDISHDMRLSSVYRSTSVSLQVCSYTLQLCRICQDGGTFHDCTVVQTFEEAEGGNLQFTVMGC